MGIESDQVVYEYLSRVGDVAHQQQLSSASRMRLVSGLREEIDRRRAKAPVDSPASVRRIIARLGSPDDVVAAAAGSGPAVPETPTLAVPVQREGESAPEPRPKGFRRDMPRPRPSDAGPGDVPSPRGAEAQDWWRRGPFAPIGYDDEDVPGFVGGIEIPELLKPGPPKQESPEQEAAEQEADADVEAEEDARPRRRLLRLPSRRWSNPLLLLAVACLFAGAVLGDPVVAGVGWAIAYVSRRLTDTETKLAVMWIPGTAVAAGLVWLWGRTDDRWGTEIPEGQMNAAITETWPWVLRGAAITSALFVLWRSQRKG